MKQLKLSHGQLFDIGFQVVYTESTTESYHVKFSDGLIEYVPSNSSWYLKSIINNKFSHFKLNVDSESTLYTLLSVFKIQIKSK